MLLSHFSLHPANYSHAAKRVPVPLQQRSQTRHTFEPIPLILSSRVRPSLRTLYNPNDQRYPSRDPETSQPPNRPPFPHRTERKNRKREAPAPTVPHLRELAKPTATYPRSGAQSKMNQRFPNSAPPPECSHSERQTMLQTSTNYRNRRGGEKGCVHRTRLEAHGERVVAIESVRWRVTVVIEGGSERAE